MWKNHSVKLLVSYLRALYTCSSVDNERCHLRTGINPRSNFWEFRMRISRRRCTAQSRKTRWFRLVTLIL